MLIRPKDKDLLVALISGSIQEPVEVWAYGSRVNGTAHDASDIDLVIRTHNLQPLNWKTFCTLREKINNSNIPVLVDLRDWASLPASFHIEILKQYEVLFPAN